MEMSVEIHKTRCGDDYTFSLFCALNLTFRSGGGGGNAQFLWRDFFPIKKFFFFKDKISLCIQLTWNLRSPYPTHQVLKWLPRATTLSLKELFHWRSIICGAPLCGLVVKRPHRPTSCVPRGRITTSPITLKGSYLESWFSTKHICHWKYFSHSFKEATEKVPADGVKLIQNCGWVPLLEH